MHLNKIDKTLFRSTIVKIPNPEFIVFYNGARKTDDVEYLRLSDAFEKEDKKGDFEWTAKMININPGHNTPLQKNCKPLYNYTQYISRIVENKKKGMSVRAAVNEAVDWAISENLLDGFFKDQKEEILAMSLTEFNAEKVYRDWLAEGREEGREDAAIAFYKNGVSIEIIAKSLKMSEEKVREIIEKKIPEKA